MARKFLISRVALAVALASGMAVTVAPAVAVAKEKAPKASFSAEFSKVAAPLQKEMDAAMANAAIKAAQSKVLAAQSNPAAFKAAQAEVNSLLGDLPQRVSALENVATTPSDKNATGMWLYQVGSLSVDSALQHKGLVMMLDSGQVAPAQLGQIQFLAGQTAYLIGNYPTAIQYLKQAYDGGYRDQQGIIQALLADAYKRSGNSAGALEVAKAELANAKASGAKPSENAIRSALQAAYEAKDPRASAEYGALLAQNYPSADTWNVAIEIVNQLSRLPKQQNIDLMRLMYLTGAMTDHRDYIEYLENADPRAYPGEAVKIMNDGLAKGKLTAADVPDKASAQSRIAADKAAIATQESAALKGGTAASVTSAADVLLSYDEPARAEALYTKAMGLAGVDANKVALRLGMAQTLQGKGAAAQANFAKVSGPLAPVAQLWSAYAATRGGATAATSPAAVQ